MFDEIIRRMVGVWGMIGLYASIYLFETAYKALMEKGKNKSWVVFLIIAAFCCSACVWIYTSP